VLPATLPGMGRNNQRRRAAKRRERLRRSAADHWDRRSSNASARTENGVANFGFDGFDAFGEFDEFEPFDEFEVPDEPGPSRCTRTQAIDDEALRHAANLSLTDHIAAARRLERSPYLALRVEDWLLSHSDDMRRTLDDQMTLRFVAVLSSLWEHGWQPADLVHVSERVGGRGPALIAALVTEQARRTDAFERAPASWVSQLRAAERRATTLGAGPRSADFRCADLLAGAGVTLVDAWVTILRLAALLEQVPALPQLLPPPSAWEKQRTRRANLSTADAARERMLSKIRALLAKAEATTYAAEAEALTAKAQDLMTRHAIDEALLRAHDDEPTEVISLRVHIPSPYPGEKTSLINHVSLTNRCKLIWLERYAIATVVGTPTDVEAVELLFTSLLVQAVRAMAEAGASRPGSFDRSATFRRSFLASYAVRIGERLTSAAEGATSSYGADLVPVLQREAEAVDREFQRLFPHTYEASPTYRAYSAYGWDAGRQAADKAIFVSGRLAASSLRTTHQLVGVLL
jgi:hypothetical protein